MGCPDITTVGYSSFSRDLWQKGQRGQVPLCATLEVTPYCNLHCAHCYIRGWQGDGPPLSFEEIRRILGEIADAGGLWLLLTGGEPFLRPDFLDIYRFAKEKGFLVSIFSNGTLITREIARVLGDLKPFSMEFSIYGATPETYERVTGSAEAFYRTRKAVEMLMEEGIPLQLKAMLMTLNVDDVWQIRDWVKSLGLHFHFDPLLNPTLNGVEDIRPLRVPPEKVLELDRQDPDRKGEWDGLVNTLLPQDNGEIPENVFTCGAGRGRFNIDPFGRLQICVLARRPSYDLRHGTFREGYYDFLLPLSQRKRTRVSECMKCANRRICTICAGWSQLETGDLEETPIPYLCEVTRLRAQNFERKNVAV